MENWIKGAIKNPGALTKSATKVGLSPMAFAKEHQGDGGTTGKRARLAMTLQSFKSHMPKGASLSPKGDLGKWRSEECRAVGGFTNGTVPLASKCLPVRPFQKAGGDNS